MKIIKKIVVVIITLCLVVNTSSFAFAGETASEVKEEKICDFIDAADEYIEVNDKGYIELNVPKDIVKMISTEEYQQIIEGIDEINSEIEAGELVVTENCTIYDVSDDELVVQGGNVDKVVKHWWGFTRYANNKNSKKLVKKLNSDASSINIIAAGAGAVALIPVPVTTLPAGVAAAASGLSAAWMNRLACLIDERNKGKGVKITLTWCMIYTVKGQ